ncbi:MAG TPA: CAP domain-containing protein [Longilinea sp.]|nr:CAP domain-containing protein [Longilinea sp.]
MVLVSMLGVPARPVSAANTISPGDLINLVNGIRTSYGLPALTENSILDGTAQATAQTMADQGLTDHIGNVKGRIAAAGYGNGANIFATENWAAYQDGATLSWIQSVWSDSAHMIPMTNKYYTDIGAGVATSSSGRVVYIVHAAYVAGGTYSDSTGSSSDTSSSATEAVSQIIMPVVTSTPHPDGSVVHVVQQGQTLWSIAIAYGTHIDILQKLNGLGSSIDIYQGESLLLPSAMPTITPTITSTILTPTSTITPTATLSAMGLTDVPASLLSQTPGASTVSDSSFVLDRRTLGLIIIIICALGLGVAMFTAIRGK